MIIDEAPQAPECSTLIPLSCPAKKIVLIGDTNQIGNMILDKQAARDFGYDSSLMERLIYNYLPSTLLT